MTRFPAVLRTLRHRATVVASALLALILSGCNFAAPQSALDPKGPVARMQDDLFMVTLWVTLFLFVTVGGALAWVVWRYRRRPGDDDASIPKQTHGSAVVEVGLILFSAAMLVIIAVPTLQGIVYMDDVPEEMKGEAVDITVRGYRWWWEFDYPDHGVITANEMVIPAGVPVRLKLIAGDVIHSFWLPKLAGKKDLMPGKENIMWIQADEDELGTFWGQCAEFCGDSHAYMLFRAHAVTPAEFDAWVAEHAKDPRLDAKGRPLVQIAETTKAEREAIYRGQQLFNANCATCHRVQANSTLHAPNLAHFAGRTTIGAGWLENTDENLKRWIQHSEEVKPGNLMYHGVNGMPGMKEAPMRDVIADDAKVEAIIAYLRTLRTPSDYTFTPEPMRR